MARLSVSSRLVVSLITPATTLFFFFFFNDTATTEIYTLSLHDALPIYRLHVPPLAKFLERYRAFAAADARVHRALPDRIDQGDRGLRPPEFIRLPAEAPDRARLGEEHSPAGNLFRGLPQRVGSSDLVDPTEREEAARGEAGLLVHRRIE